MDVFLETFRKIILVIFLMLICSFLIGALVMLLWNWLIPVIFDLPSISYLQGCGIAFLCSLLFKTTITINDD